MPTFGDRLKTLRKERNLTQEELANMFFLNKSSVSRYERDNQMPESDTLQKIADYFKVTVDYLLGRSDVRNPHKTESEFVETDEKRLVQAEKSEQYKTLKDDLIELMIRQGIIKDKSSVNEKHLEFIEYAIETYKNEQNNG